MQTRPYEMDRFLHRDYSRGDGNDPQVLSSRVKSRIATVSRFTAYRIPGITSSAKYFIDRMAFSWGMLPQAKTLTK